MSQLRPHSIWHCIRKYPISFAWYTFGVIVLTVAATLGVR